MELVQVLEEMDIGAEDVIRRFCNNKELLIKYLKKFKGDETFSQLEESVKKSDYQEIERFAHTLKGVSANFGMDKLRDSSDALVVQMRAGQYDKTEELMDDIRKEYERLLEKLELLD